MHRSLPWPERPLQQSPMVHGYFSVPPAPALRPHRWKNTAHALACTRERNQECSGMLLGHKQLHQVSTVSSQKHLVNTFKHTVPRIAEFRKCWSLDMVSRRQVVGMELRAKVCCSNTPNNDVFGGQDKRVRIYQIKQIMTSPSIMRSRTRHSKQQHPHPGTFVAPLPV